MNLHKTVKKVETQIEKLKIESVLKCFLLFIFTLLNVSSMLSQNNTYQYNYKNFDNSTVEIKLSINNSYIKYSNKNWFDLANMGSDKMTNYWKLVKSIFKNNRDSLKFVYKMFAKALPNVSDEYFINTVVRFVQSIPYKIPPMNYKGKKTSGLFAPAICLSEGYGDCDTKSLLLCCILAHRYKLIFLVGSSHAFIGIKIPPINGQEYVEIDGEKYVLCEMTYFWDLGNLPTSSKYDINKGKYQFCKLIY